MSTLYIVATPIGNLADITQRALSVLAEVDLIACEDTRHSRILLDHYAIRTPTVSYHQHSRVTKIDWLLEQLAAGRDIALISDAGTPTIADPGGLLVEQVYRHNASIVEAGERRQGFKGQSMEPIKIVTIPGPSALAAALSVSGLPADRFLFLGFLPKKKGRATLLKNLTPLLRLAAVETVAFYESANRLAGTLTDLNSAFGDELADRTTVCLARELTKRYEELWRGALPAAVEWASEPRKGEFVVILNIKRR